MTPFRPFFPKDFVHDRHASDASLSFRIKTCRVQATALLSAPPHVFSPSNKLQSSERRRARTDSFPQLPVCCTEFTAANPGQAWPAQGCGKTPACLAAASTLAAAASSLHRYFLTACWKSSSLTTGPVPSHLAFFCRSAQRPSRSKSPLRAFGQFWIFSL